MNRIQRAWQVLTGRSEAPAQSKGYLSNVADGWLGAVLGMDDDAERVDLLKTATAYRAISRIYNDLAACPIVFEYEKNNEWVEIERGDTTFGDIAGVFQRCNPHEGRTALWARFHASMELTGHAVLFTDYRNNGQPAKGKAPQELRVLYGPRVKPVWPNVRTMFGEPVAYKIGDGQVRPDEVLYHAYPSAEDEWGFISPSDAAAIYAAVENELPRYQVEFFKNGARGTVALSTDQTPSEAQREQMERAWEKKNVGRGNRFRVWLLTHGLKAQELSGRRDTDFVDLFGMVKEQVSMIYGVPPAFLSDYGDSGVRANLEEQTPMYVEGTLYPKARLLEENLTEIVCPRFVPRGVKNGQGLIRARFDWDRVPMVQRMNLARATAYLTLTGGPVLTPNEARGDLHQAPVVGGDVLILPNATPTFLGPVQQPKKLLPAPVKKARKWIDSPERHAKRIASGVSLDRFEKPAEKLVKTYFSQAEARALHRWEQGKGIAGLIRKDDDDTFDEDAETEAAAALIQRIYTSILTVRGAEAASEAGGESSDFLITDPRVVEFLTEHAYEQGKRITGTTAELLRQVIASGNANGDTVQEIATAIRDVFGVRRDNALTIARTETVKAYNFSTFAGYKDSGLVEKVGWLTSHDAAVRDSHAEIDGDTVSLGEQFANGCAYPGDPSGEAAEVINCYLPGTLVSGAFVSGLKAGYAGPAREIQTARGYRLSVTPNHPVLTANGWIPASALRKGDHLLSYAGEVGLAMKRDVDDQNGEARIEDVFEALAADRGLRSTVVSRLDLHGDARWVDQKVHVVRPHGELLKDSQPSVTDLPGERILVMAATQQSSLHRAGSRDPDGEGVARSAASLPGGGHLPANAVGVALQDSPFHALGCGLAAGLNSTLPKPQVNDIATHSRFCRELVDRGSGLVAPDQVLEVRDFEFAGHVYDLQSVSGWMMAQGIVCSNCRCVLEIADDLAPKSFAVAPGTFSKLFRKEALTPARPITEHAAHE